MPNVSSAQIGAAGELLVQRQLLECGIDSARMTTDYGIDLVAYDKGTRKSFTIQVKTRQPERAGDRNRFAWRIDKGKEKTTNLFAFVSDDKAWYLGSADLRKFGQKRSNHTMFFFYEERAPKDRLHERDFVTYKGGQGIKRFLRSSLSPSGSCAGEKTDPGGRSHRARRERRSEDDER